MRTQHNIPQFCSFAGHSIKRSGISKSVIRSSFFGFFGLLLVTRLLPAQEAATESLEARLERGKVIYQNLCASCHGELGEGVPGQYENALTGDSTIGQLTELIEKTMPKDEADKCVGADAALVSEYIHHRFYSEAAQIRNRPPRLGLARLTGPNCVNRSPTSTVISKSKCGSQTRRAHRPSTSTVIDGRMKTKS